MNTINETITSYLSAVRDSRSEKTHLTYRHALALFTQNTNGADLTPETYALFLRSIADSPANTQAVYRTAVLGLYAYYGIDHPVNMAALHEHSKRLCKKVKVGRPQFDREAIEQFVSYMETLQNVIAEWRDRAFVLTLVDTGLRMFEACALKRGDIFWREYYADITGKGDVDAKVRFSDRAIDALTDYLTRRQSLDAAMGVQVNTLPLFARHDGKAHDKVLPISVNGMWQSIKERMKQGGIDSTKIRMHDFRHYFITDYYEYSNNISATKTVARHANSKTTFRYIHTDEEADRIYHERHNRGDK